jgi:hypothetical protein
MLSLLGTFVFGGIIIFLLILLCAYVASEFEGTILEKMAEVLFYIVLTLAMIFIAYIVISFTKILLSYIVISFTKILLS